MKRAKYICIEGTEGVGKTTQVKLLTDSLRSQGLRVLQTKEPGTDLIPLTVQLRGIMLDNQYDNILTNTARELISQSIRSIHMERLVLPSLYDYDYIIQDRGVLTGLSYGVACGHDEMWLSDLAERVMPTDELTEQPVEYDCVVYLKGDTSKNLNRARSSKQEFASGDAMESRGSKFIENVSKNMDFYSKNFNTIEINVDDKSIEEVHSDILTSLKLKDT